MADDVTSAEMEFCGCVQMGKTLGCMHLACSNSNILPGLLLRLSYKYDSIVKTHVKEIFQKSRYLPPRWILMTWTRRNYPLSLRCIGKLGLWKSITSKAVCESTR